MTAGAPKRCRHSGAQHLQRHSKGVTMTRHETGAALLWSLLLCAPAAFAPTPLAPLTFQEAIQRANDTYPAIQASAARVSADEAGGDLARTAYLPRLDYGLQVNRATRNNVAGLLLPGTPLPSISGPVSESTSSSTM